jgi:regulator of extracellular matrix RemA (YlzA/DUF370 family)
VRSHCQSQGAPCKACQSLRGGNGVRHGVNVLKTGSLALLNVGFGNVVPHHRIVAIVSPLGAPMKRLRDHARDTGRLVDATQGRRTRALVITDSDHVIQSALASETLAARFHGAQSQSPADEPDPALDAADVDGDTA